MKKIMPLNEDGHTFRDLPILDPRAASPSRSAGPVHDEQVKKLTPTSRTVPRAQAHQWHAAFYHVSKGIVHRPTSDMQLFISAGFERSRFATSERFYEKPAHDRLRNCALPSESKTRSPSFQTSVSRRKRFSISTFAQILFRFFSL